MALQLKLDPSNLEAGAKRAKSSLDTVKAGAFQAESAIDAMAKQGAGAMLRFDTTLRGSATAMTAAVAATTGATRANATWASSLVLVTREQQEAQAALARQSAAFDEYRAAVQRAAQSNNAMQGGLSGVSDDSSSMAYQVQNAAYQIGDFAVQVAGGAGAVRALSQQLPQLLGGFGLFGAVIGAAVAIGGALVPVLFDMGSGAETVDDRVEALNATLDDFNRNASIGVSAIGDLREQYGMWANEVRATAQWMAQVNVGQAREVLLQKAFTFSTGISEIAESERRAAEAAMLFSESQSKMDLAVFGALKNDAAAAAKEMGVTVDQALSLNDAFVNFSGAASMEDLQSKSKEALDVIQAMFPAGQLVPPEIAKVAEHFQEVYNKATQGLVTMQDMPAVLSGAADAAGGLATAMGSVGMAANAALSQMIQMDVTRRAMQSAAQRQAAAPGGIGPAGMGDGSAAYTSSTERALAEAEAAKARLLAAPAYVIPQDTGGSSGGGAAAVDRTREAYDRLMASLDPVVARTQDMAEATAVADAALAAHDITAAEHANALDLIRDKYAETTSAMSDLRDAGGNAIDSLIDGSMNLSQALKQMAKDLIFATIKAQLLQHVTGATSGMSIGGILMQGIIGGFSGGAASGAGRVLDISSLAKMDTGGSIPVGGMAMVGERGPEIVRATTGGAVVTSRVDTAAIVNRAAQPQAMRVEVVMQGGDLVMSDDGTIYAKIKASAQAAAQSGAAQAVQTVKRSLNQWNGDIQRDGALA